MKAFYECIPCIIRQSLDIARLHRLDDKTKLNLLQKVMCYLDNIDPKKSSPPEITKYVHQIIKKQLGKQDLYAREKRQQNKLAIKLKPWAEHEIEKARDPLLAAIKLAIAGNIIDYGTASFFSLEDSLRALEHQKFGIDNYAQFKPLLKIPRKILYIGDNAGEIVFDTLLVKELIKRGQQITFAVKSDYVLNDVTMADAKVSGMNKLVKVIESGSTTAGTLLKETTSEFNKLYQAADLIIAKGQGNFETLPLNDKRIFFLLKMKCVYLAKEVRVNYGDILFIRGGWGKR